MDARVNGRRPVGYALWVTCTLRGRTARMIRVDSNFACIFTSLFVYRISYVIFVVCSRQREEESGTRRTASMIRVWSTSKPT
jgi:hypothetical protein